MAGIRASAVGWGLTKLDDPAISANPAGPMAVAAARERYGTSSQRRTILMMPQTTASQGTSPGTRVTRIITRDRKLIRNARCLEVFLMITFDKQAMGQPKAVIDPVNSRLNVRNRSSARLIRAIRPRPPYPHPRSAICRHWRTSPTTAVECLAII